ncbi:cyclic nucleotide-binding domain-containing protein [Acidobacteriota bacterium]
MHLLEFPALADFTKKEREFLHSISRSLSFSAGTVIFKEGDPGDGLYFIVSGLVTIFRELPENQKQILTTFSSGSYFGEMSIIDNKPRAASAKAETHVETRFMPKRDFEDAMTHTEIRPKLYKAFLEETFRRLRKTNRNACEIVMRSWEAQEELEKIRESIRTLASEKIRVPLSVIRSSASILDEDGLSHEEKGRFIETLENHASKLEGIVGEIVHLTHLSGGAFNPGRARFCLTSLLRAVLERRMRMAGKGLKLEARFNGADLFVVGDHYLLDRALMELLNLAFSWTKPEGRLVVDVNPLNSNGRRRVEIVIISEMEQDQKDRMVKQISLWENGEDGIAAARQIAWIHEGMLFARWIDKPFSGVNYSFNLPML